MPLELSLARRIGCVVAAIGLTAVAAVGAFRLVECPDEPELEREREQFEAARELGGAAAILALSVLADSGLERYRGAYHNPAITRLSRVARQSEGRRAAPRTERRHALQ